MNLKDELYNRLERKKIEINWNKNPIPMDKFLSFLTVSVERSTDYLGCYTGWTELNNKDINLKIRGGLVGGTEWLDSIEYGKKLSNSYNNFVNPFFLFDILTDEGKSFFVKYYEEDIQNILDDAHSRIEHLKKQHSAAMMLHDNLMDEVTAIRSIPKP